MGLSETELEELLRERVPETTSISVRAEHQSASPVPSSSTDISSPPLTPEDSYYHDDLYPGHPDGYRNNPSVPTLRGPNHCPHCLCSPCVITHPPDWLRGTSSPHPGNDEKRYDKYRRFWKLLNKLGLWCDDEYLERKARRTVIHDRREIIPLCVIRDIRQRFPSVDGVYKDYKSTFEAENEI